MVLDIVGGPCSRPDSRSRQIGLYGMLRRPDIFEQLHAAGLITGPAIVLVLLASVPTRNIA